jgi:hypothetical protein
MEMSRGWDVGVLACAAAVLALPESARAACSLTMGDFDGSGRIDVRIVGTGQRVVIDDAQSSYRARVDCNGDGTFGGPPDIDTGLQPLDVETFDLRGLGDVDYETTAAFSNAVKNISVTFSPPRPGNENRVCLSLGSAIQAGSNIVVDLLGSAGPDTVTLVSYVEVSDSSLTLRGDLGAGDDRLFYLMQGRPTVNSVLTTDVDMGSGSNVFQTSVEGGDNATILTNAVGSPLQTQVDRFQATLGGGFTTGSRYLTRFALLGGNDVVTVYADPAGAHPLTVTNSVVAVRARGGAGNDTLAFVAPSTGVTNNGMFELDLAGGPGNDVITADWSARIDGGGTTRLRLSGDDGADVVWGALDLNSTVTRPTVDVLFQGGNGNDILYTAVIDAAGLASYRPLGTTRTDGGAGDDACYFFGSGSHQSLSCESGS